MTLSQSRYYFFFISIPSCCPHFCVIIYRHVFKMISEKDIGLNIEKEMCINDQKQKNKSKYLKTQYHTLLNVAAFVNLYK